MATKTYESVSGIRISFPVTVSEVTTRIELPFTTTSSGIQAAIEASHYFTSGKISLSGNYEANEKARRTDDVTSGKLVSADIDDNGTQYVAGDVITMTKGVIIKVLTVDDGAILTYEVENAGSTIAVDDTLSQVETTSTAGAGFQLVVTEATPATMFPETSPFKAVSFDEVLNISDAVKVLRAEPYNVHHTKLRTPQAVLAQAIEHSVSFPNWTI